MKKDVTTFTRYFVILILVFIVWLVYVYRISQTPDIKAFFGQETSGL